ncbi:phosphate ABC transporter permease PstA [Caldibacillus thermolactis]|jgi:phosphate transport system permease protein|uniref:Phosphate transport system permease protein PstA n=1 Tax=Pallidibacillus thermolactis TaxID=251051 RepID=A0ABT2WJ26_9BACI|nr:phosphate ABC transporter permease PstA [Pallidibacillus thermolactis]MCU9595466.1 phosphate ABC transporter permease PstA [Pallidibacillus thermolactis]MCU9601193.1 phosphate ABC transporter permease PstA [Pallidibacillus thermolactis subsp. kokeshiiformis]MED1673437.1 phosphate ABC transporter permease PstA [Pallidibacillus thermolactis subsp. kokeshiiformis]
MVRLIDQNKVTKNIQPRIFRNSIYKYFFLAATTLCLLILAVLFIRVLRQGLPHLDWQFLTSTPSRKPEEAGVYTAFIGTVWMMAVVIPVTFVLGVGAAIYLEEYAKKTKFTTFIETNISNLAGVPSVVYGLLGLTLFARAFALGQSVLAAGLTMSLLVLPVIIVAAQEAIRSVPNELREASYGMGATKWTTIYKVVLPTAIPSILTGAILAISRAIGETAPLVVLGIPLFLIQTPSTFFDSFTALPMQIYNWTGRPQAEFQEIAAAGIIVLLVLLIVLNSIAVFIRNKFSKKL